MSHDATFDPALVEERDWVRQLCGDTDMSAAQLDDVQIDAFILEAQTNYTAGAWVKYFAAEMAGRAMISRWSAKGQGIAEKTVDGLRLRYAGSDSSATTTAYEAHLKKLKSTGNKLMLRATTAAGRAPAAFRVL